MDETLPIKRTQLPGLMFGEEQARNIERYLSGIPVGIDALITWVNAIVPTMEKTDA